MTMQETPDAPRLPHGYATYDDALRAIVSLYAERAIDSERDYWRASRASSRGVDEAALHVYHQCWVARDAVSQHWAMGDARGPFWRGVGVDSEPNGAWLRIVKADVDARLDGDMGRPLPEPGAP